jgi:rhodanese-related sulfurtransferase
MVFVLMVVACSDAGNDHLAVPADSQEPAAESGEPAVEPELSGPEIPAVIPEGTWITVEDLYAMTRATVKPVVFDLRDYAHFSYAHVPKAKSLPYRFLDDRFYEIEREKPLALVCISDEEALGSYQLLVENGYDPALLRVITIDDDMAAWQAAGFPIESKGVSRC